MSETLQSLLERVSIPANLLEEPAPDADALASILKAAVTAPDHGGLRPWRFIKIDGRARENLGQIFCEAAQQQSPDIDADALSAIRGKPLRSPMIVAVVAAVKDHPKIPDQEQLFSAAAAAQNLQLAANALGYGSIWLTGPYARDTYVSEKLGLKPKECIVAFIYLGTPSAAASIARKKIQRRPDPADFLVEWTG